MPERTRAAFDERAFIRWPRLFRAATRWTFGLRHGSWVRRYLLVRTTQLSYAGQNRDDWRLSLLPYDDRSILQNVPIRGSGERVAGVRFEYQGLEGARRLAEDWKDVYPDIHFELVELVDVGDGRLLVLSWLSARGRGSGVEVRERFAQLLEFTDGAIIRHRNWLGSWNDGLEAVGLAGGGGAGS